MNNSFINELIRKNIGLVYYVVNNFRVSKFDRDDLIQEGIIGLLDAIKGFDSEKGFCFSSYAIPFIKGRVLKEYKRLKKEEHLCVNEIIFYDSNIDFLTSLTENEKILFQFIYKDKLTQNEMAKIMKCSQSSISRKVNKIKLKIKGKL